MSKQIKWHPSFISLFSLPFEQLDWDNFVSLYQSLSLWEETERPFTPLCERTSLELKMVNKPKSNAANTLELKSLNAPLARWLVATFPSITNLTLDAYSSTECLALDALAPLL